MEPVPTVGGIFAFAQKTLKGAGYFFRLFNLLFCC